MGKRIGLTQCINPSHNDSTPSMAVYDQGESKLQVYCFGCGYHAWVSPTDIDISSNNKENSRAINSIITRSADYTQLVIDFFLKRNFKKEDIPWGYITMGDESHYQLLGGGTSAVAWTRPYMEWNLYNRYITILGTQRRYLDDRKPKTKYFPDSNGLYAKEAWYEMTASSTKGLRICESWIDAAWVHSQQVDDWDVMTILGTSTTHIESQLYKLSQDYHTFSLYFDGDKPGIKATNKIKRVLDDLDSDCTVYTTPGRKVYELND